MLRLVVVSRMDVRVAKGCTLWHLCGRTAKRVCQLADSYHFYVGNGVEAAFSAGTSCRVLLNEMIRLEIVS